VQNWTEQKSRKEAEVRNGTQVDRIRGVDLRVVSGKDRELQVAE
jgi:hypothetical protein